MWWLRPSILVPRRQRKAGPVTSSSMIYILSPKLAGTTQKQAMKEP